MSKFSDDLEEQGMNLKSWPHQFTKNGSSKQIGENKNFEASEGTPMKVLSYQMVCVHCMAEYWTIESGPPPGPCPARNKDRELRRILG